MLFSCVCVCIFLLSLLARPFKNPDQISVKKYAAGTLAITKLRIIRVWQPLVLSLFPSQEGVACLIKHRIQEGVSLAKRACRLSSYYNCVNDRAIRGYASAVFAAAKRFAGNQDGAKEHLTDALEVRFHLIYLYWTPSSWHKWWILNNHSAKWRWIVVARQTLITDNKLNNCFSTQQTSDWPAPNSHLISDHSRQNNLEGNPGHCWKMNSEHHPEFECAWKTLMTTGLVYTIKRLSYWWPFKRVARSNELWF